MQKIILAHDWIGPEGPWPNGQSLDFYSNPNSYECSLYSVSNTHVYNLESYRHQFTYSKIKPIIGSSYQRKHITECSGKFVYELTPLLKPYQWVDTAFDNVSELALKKQQQGQCLFVINDLNEGYSNKDYNFFEGIHRQIDKYQLNYNNILYITMNLVLEEEYTKWLKNNNIKKNIKIYPISVFEYSSNKNKIKKPNKHFICLNRQPNAVRQCLVYELWRRDLLKYGYVSMPDPSIPQDVEFNKDNLKIFDLDDSQWNEFINSLPYEVDGRDFTAQTCDFNSIGDFYQDSVYSIITENDFGNNDCIKLSEKTFGALDNYCLPLHYYHSNIVKELSKNNYQVPNNLVSASDKIEKFYALLNTIEDICKTPIEQLHLKTLNNRIHNHNNLKQRSKKTNREIFKKWKTFW